MKIDKEIYNTICTFGDVSCGETFVRVDDGDLYLKIKDPGSLMFNVINLRLDEIGYIKALDRVIRVRVKIVPDSKEENDCYEDDFI